MSSTATQRLLLDIALLCIRASISDGALPAIAGGMLIAMPSDTSSVVLDLLLRSNVRHAV